VLQQSTYRHINISISGVLTSTYHEVSVQHAYGKQGRGTDTWNGSTNVQRPKK